MSGSSLLLKDKVALYWAQAVAPAMKARRFGRIINVSSLAAKTGGLTAGTAYSVSKGR